MNRRIKSYLRRLSPRAIRQHLILAGPLRGCSIVTSWHDYPAAILGRTERPLLEWFTKNVNLGETWLDMGAHYGYTAIALSRLVGQQGRVFAFEPMVSTAACLARTRQLNDFPQLIILPLGLAAPGTLEMKQLPVTRGMVDSTLPKDEGHTEWQETIMVVRFDWLWSRICGGNQRIDGVKIDVQGMELEALQGMRGSLSEWKPRLVIEFHSGVDRKRLLDLLEEAGYLRRSIPIEPEPGETEPQYVNDHSYAFEPV